MDRDEAKKLEAQIQEHDRHEHKLAMAAYYIARDQLYCAQDSFERAKRLVNETKSRLDRWK